MVRWWRLLADADPRAGAARSGMPAVTPEQGVALFDAALAVTSRLVMPVRLDFSVLRSLSAVPALLRGLVRTRTRRTVASAATAEGLTQRLAEARPRPSASPPPGRPGRAPGRRRARATVPA